jgi:hypothetical protein
MAHNGETNRIEIWYHNILPVEIIQNEVVESPFLLFIPHSLLLTMKFFTAVLAITTLIQASPVPKGSTSPALPSDQTSNGVNKEIKADVNKPFTLPLVASNRFRAGTPNKLLSSILSAEKDFRESNFEDASPVITQEGSDGEIDLSPLELTDKLAEPPQAVQVSENHQCTTAIKSKTLSGEVLKERRGSPDSPTLVGGKEPIGVEPTGEIALPAEEILESEQSPEELVEIDNVSTHGGEIVELPSTNKILDKRSSYAPTRPVPICTNRQSASLQYARGLKAHDIGYNSDKPVLGYISEPILGYNSDHPAFSNNSEDSSSGEGSSEDDTEPVLITVPDHSGIFDKEWKLNQDKWPEIEGFGFQGSKEHRASTSGYQTTAETDLIAKQNEVVGLKRALTLEAVVEMLNGVIEKFLAAVILAKVSEYVNASWEGVEKPGAIAIVSADAQTVRDSTVYILPQSKNAKLTLSKPHSVRREDEDFAKSVSDISRTDSDIDEESSVINDEELKSKISELIGMLNNIFHSDLYDTPGPYIPTDVANFPENIVTEELAPTAPQKRDSDDEELEAEPELDPNRHVNWDQMRIAVKFMLAQANPDYVAPPYNPDDYVPLNYTLQDLGKFITAAFGPKEEDSDKKEKRAPPWKISSPSSSRNLRYSSQSRPGRKSKAGTQNMVHVLGDSKLNGFRHTPARPLGRFNRHRVTKPRIELSEPNEPRLKADVELNKPYDIEFPLRLNTGDLSGSDTRFDKSSTEDTVAKVTVLEELAPEETIPPEPTSSDLSEYADQLNDAPGTGGNGPPSDTMITEEKNAYAHPNSADGPEITPSTVSTHPVLQARLSFETDIDSDFDLELELALLSDDASPISGLEFLGSSDDDDDDDGLGRGEIDVYFFSAPEFEYDVEDEPITEPVLPIDLPRIPSSFRPARPTKTPPKLEPLFPNVHFDVALAKAAPPAYDPEADLANDGPLSLVPFPENGRFALVGESAVFAYCGEELGLVV